MNPEETKTPRPSVQEITDAQTAPGIHPPPARSPEENIDDPGTLSQAVSEEVNVTASGGRATGTTEFRMTDAGVKTAPAPNVDPASGRIITEDGVVPPGGLTVAPPPPEDPTGTPGRTAATTPALGEAAPGGNDGE